MRWRYTSLDRRLHRRWKAVLRERILTTVTCIMLGALASLAGCASRPPVDGPAELPTTLPPDPVPHEEPRSRYGNGPYYKVLGQRYEVMKSGTGYREQGVASWYGKKFHGKPTSSRETYDMYA